jgi:hypothetical protein
MSKMTKEQEAAFLEGLRVLTLQTGVVIGGCGCCGSPSLGALAEGEGDSFYRREPYGEEKVEWISPREVAEEERRREAYKRSEAYMAVTPPYLTEDTMHEVDMEEVDGLAGLLGEPAPDRTPAEPTQQQAGSIE